MSYNQGCWKRMVNPLVDHGVELWCLVGWFRHIWGDTGRLDFFKYLENYAQYMWFVGLFSVFS